MQDLRGKVAVVTGASRGGGRGIALALGEQGATVYVTGRSVRGEPTTDDLPGTIDETAEKVAARGGMGIPVRCDHTVDAEVEALFERVKQEQDRIDILVNNAWGGYEKYSSAPFDTSFWEQPLWRWDKMLTAGVRSHMVSSYFAVPLMLPHGQGLIINTTYWDQDKYLGNLFYDIAKAAINRMAYGLALELQEYGITAVALSPGWMRTEAVLAHDHTPEELATTESVEYIGRAVVALATDRGVMEKTGQVLRTRELGRDYGFTDIDGKNPPL